MLNAIIRDVTRMLVMRFTNWSINTGTEYLARRSGGADKDGKLTPAGQKQVEGMKTTANRVRDVQRMLRRMR